MDIKKIIPNINKHINNDIELYRSWGNEQTLQLIVEAMPNSA
ncbi:MAG TPA: hypothetical protein VFC84_11435 [Desulfosporosinus sp.]|nr:hypothetical protein [Desulfosporosinus sp.]